MNQPPVHHPIATLDASLSPVTALRFIVRNEITYLLGGTTDGVFFIFDMYRRKKLYQIMLKSKISEIHHHPTQWYEIITQESIGQLTFWRLNANFQFVFYHLVYVDTEFPRSVIAANRILFPHQYSIQMLNLDELKCIIPPKRMLCGLMDWQFGSHTALISIKHNNESYAVSGYFNGSLIIRELQQNGFSIRFPTICPSPICCMVYNQENQELVVSGDGSISLGVFRVIADNNGNLDLKFHSQILIGLASTILTIDSRNNFLYCGRLDEIKIFNLKAMTFYPTSPPKISSINCITCSPAKVAGWSNMYVCAVAYENGAIRLWTYDVFYNYETQDSVIVV